MSRDANVIGDDRKRVRENARHVSVFRYTSEKRTQLAIVRAVGRSTAAWLGLYTDCSSLSQCKGRTLVPAKELGIDPGRALPKG